MPKKRSILVRILSYSLLTIGGLAVLSTVSNAVLTMVEKLNNPPPGKMVVVNGKKMHVFTSGQGTNVVLLSGLGTRSPFYDFLPLLHELEGSVRVSIVEYPGYGWSDDTDAPRTVEQSVEELRSALQGAGVLPPYTLVAHSISGLQALSYSNKYPAEVAAVVGLDSSLPAQAQYLHLVPQAVNVNEVLGILGLVRIGLAVSPALSGASPDLSPSETEAFLRITNWTIGSRAIANEGDRIVENLKSLDGWSYPKTIPVTLVLAGENVNSQTSPIPGDAWKTEHEILVKGNPRGKVIVLNGGHYIHHGNAPQVAALILECALGR